MFIHDQKDHLHLAMNVIIQLVVGFPLELIHSWWRVLIVYVSGVIAGALSYAFFSPPCGGLVGASAGVYALLAAHISSSLLVRILAILFLVSKISSFFLKSIESQQKCIHPQLHRYYLLPDRYSIIFQGKFK